MCIYLFFLPFQLIEQFQWYTIPGVSIGEYILRARFNHELTVRVVAAFIYLGFLAAGEEIEQPFGTFHSVPILTCCIDMRIPIGYDEVCIWHVLGLVIELTMSTERFGPGHVLPRDYSC